MSVKLDTEHSQDNLLYLMMTKAGSSSCCIRSTHMITAQKLSARCRQTKTQQYDAEAMRYLGYALYPLVIGYAIYALLYQSHKSWYSWVLNSLVGAVYTFGFILMCPQVHTYC